MLSQILIFILPFIVSIPYFTYPFSESFSASYRKIYFFSDDYTPTLLTSYNYSLNLPSPSGSAFSENTYFSHLEILTQTKTILRLPTNNYVIAGLKNNQLLIFTSTGKTIYSINFYSITEQNEEVTLGFYDSSNLYISFVDNEKRSKIILFNYYTYTYKELYSKHIWRSISYTKYQCEYLHLINNLICIFTPQDNSIYLDTFNKYGQIGDSEVIVSTYPDVPLKNVNFLILSDSNYNNNVYSEIVIVGINSSTVYLYTIRFEMNINRVYSWELLHSNKIEESCTIYKLIKVRDDYFILDINEYKFYYITKDLKLVQNDMTYTTLYNKAAIYQVKDTDLFALNYNVEPLITDAIAYFSPNKMCINFRRQMKFSLMGSKPTKIYLYEFLNNATYGNITDYSKLRVVIFETPPRGNLRGCFENSTCELITEGNDVSKNYREYDFFSRTQEILKIPFYISEQLEDSEFRIPSSLCTLEIEILSFKNNVPCSSDRDLLIYYPGVELPTCYQILDYLSPTLDLNDKEYFTAYIHLDLETFYKNFELIFPVQQTFLNQLSSVVNETVHTSILNINGIDFSYYFYPLINDNPTLILQTANSSLISIPNECLANVSKQYSLTNERFYVGSFIYSSNKSLPYSYEYTLFDSQGNTLSLNTCSGLNGVVYQSLTNIETFRNFFSLGQSLTEQERKEVFNLKGDFFNNICAVFNLEDLTRDTTLKIRRNEYYPTINLCESNCTFISVDFHYESVYCSCPIKEKIDFNRTNVYEGLNAFANYKQEVNIVIIKCINEFFTELFSNENIGFYIMFILLVLQILLMIYYYLISLSKIKKSVIKVSHFKKPISTSNFNEKITGSFPFNQSEKSIGSGLTSKNDSLHSMNSFSKFSGFNGVNTRYSLYSFSSSAASLKDTTTFSSTFTNNKDSASSNNQGNNSQINIKKGISDILFRKYWKFLQIQHTLVSLLYMRNKFNRATLKYIYMLSYLSLSITLNCLLYSNKYIERNYYYDDSNENTSINKLGFIIEHQLDKVIIAFVLCLIIYRFFFYLIFAYIRMEYKRKKVTNKEILMNEMHKANLRVSIFFIIDILISIFGVYYCSVFCIIYPKTQTSLLLCSLISFLFGFLAPFVTSFIYAIVGVIAKLFNVRILKMALRIINNKPL